MGWGPGCSVKVEQVNEKSCSALWTHDGKARIKAAEGRDDGCAGGRSAGSVVLPSTVGDRPSPLWAGLS